MKSEQGQKTTGTQKSQVRESDSGSLKQKGICQKNMQESERNKEMHTENKILLHPCI